MSNVTPSKFRDNPNISNLQQFHIERENEISLETADKLRVIKGMALLIIFSSLIISSIIFYNCPNYNPDLVLEGNHDYSTRTDQHKFNTPIYKLMTKYIKSNHIELDVQLEKEFTGLQSPSKNLKIVLKFAKSRAHIKIYDINDYKNQFLLDSEFFSDNDLEMNGFGKIDNVQNSNLGIKIEDHPFGFTIYRKDNNEVLFDTTHSNDNENFDTYMYFAENYLQISSALTESHIVYGLGDNAQSKISLEPGKYQFWNSDPFNDKVSSDQGKSIYSSYPNFISTNSVTMKSFGVIMINSSPTEVILDKKYITYKMSSGIVDLYVLDGPRVLDVIYTGHRLLGKPILGKFEDLNWGANVITSNTNDDINKIISMDKSNIFPVGSFWIDSKDYEDSSILHKDQEEELKNNGYNLNWYIKSPLSTNSQYFDFAKENNICIKDSNGNEILGTLPNADPNEKFCVLDYFNDHSLELRKLIFESKFTNSTQLNLYMNEPFLILENQKENMQKLPVFKDNEEMIENLYKNTLPLDAQMGDNAKNKMLNMHNLYSLKESQIYFNLLSDNNKSPMLFSRSGFSGSQQYSGKWLGYIEPSWNGLRYAIRQTIISNLQGNPNVVHEACGYSEFSSDLETKYKQFELNREVCLRWLQFSSVNLQARVNNWEIFELLKGEYKKSVESSIELRQRLNVYLYSNQMKNAIDGGGYILPVSAFCTQFENEDYKDYLFSSDTQFMLGPNFLASPVVKSNQRTKLTYFPNEVFYDFYTGEIINPDGEVSLEVDAPLDKLPLFARGGFITPLQSGDLSVKNMEEMKKKNLELLIALGQDYQAQGRIIVGDSTKNYFRMEFVSIYLKDQGEIDIIFRVSKNSYNVSSIYPKIEKITIYGAPGVPNKIEYESNEQEFFEIDTENILYNEETKKIELTLDEDVELKLSNLNFKVILHNI